VKLLPAFARSWHAGASCALVLVSLGLVPCACRRATNTAALPPDALRLRVPETLLVAPAGRAQDAKLRPYIAALAALGRAPRLISGGALEHAEPADLMLVVPAESARMLSPRHVAALARLVERGALLLTDEVTPVSLALGVLAGASIEVSRLREQAYPSVAIGWAKPERVTTLAATKAATVLTVEEQTGGVLALLVPHGEGYAVVLARALDDEGGQGFMRYPFLPQALMRAGLRLPFSSPRLAAFFDYGYRDGADVDALAKRWRAAGISALHVGAWDFWDKGGDTDAYLRRLIGACHAQGLLVYAWLELPHVNLDFWDRHPKWREKTATGADAHLDWRYLMNLKDPDCWREVVAGLERLVARFDWDGVNLGEVYYDSPMGPSEPEQMTPFNALVRQEYLAKSGIDPVDFLKVDSPSYWRSHPAAWGAFVDYRVELERALNESLLAVLARVQKESKPDLGLTVTYVDNLYDASMREAVGADVKGILPLLARYDFTLVIEDPMTTWHLGPERYSLLARRYAALTTRQDKLGIDINVVERSGAIYPTAKQTGGELAALFFHTGKSFATVMVYAEQSIDDQDLGFIANALAGEVTTETLPDGVALASPYPLRFESGLGGADFFVDGELWPCVDGGAVLLPAGSHRVAARKPHSHAAAAVAVGAAAASAPGAVTARDVVTPSARSARLRVLRLNGTLREARYLDDGALELGYSAEARAFVDFDLAPSSVSVDGKSVALVAGATSLVLPRGRHMLRASRATEPAARP